MHFPVCIFGDSNLTCGWTFKCMGTLMLKSHCHLCNLFMYASSQRNSHTYPAYHYPYDYETTACTCHSLHFEFHRLTPQKTLFCSLFYIVHYMTVSEHHIYIYIYIYILYISLPPSSKVSLFLNMVNISIYALCRSNRLCHNKWLIIL